MAPKKKLVKVGTQLPPDLFDRLKSYADGRGIKMQWVITEAVRAHLKELSK